MKGANGPIHPVPFYELTLESNMFWQHLRPVACGRILSTLALGFLLSAGGSLGNHLDGEAPVVDGVLRHVDPLAPNALDGTWLFCFENKPATFPPTRPEGPWRPVKVPGQWKVSGITGDGVGWMKFQFTMAPGSKEALGGKDLVLKLPLTANAYEIFLNGHPAGGKGRIGRDGELVQKVFDGGVFHLPHSKLLAPGTNEVAIRIVTYWGHAGIQLYPPWLGEEESIRKRVDGERYLGVFLIALFFFAGLSHLLLWLGNRKETHYLHFFLLCLSIASVQAGALSLGYLVHDNPHWNGLLILWPIVTMHVWLVHFFSGFYRARLTVWKRVAEALAFLYLLPFFIHFAWPPIYPVIDNIALPLGILTFIVYMVLGAFLTIRGVFRKYAGARLILVGYILYAAMAVLDLLQQAGLHVGYQNSFLGYGFLALSMMGGMIIQLIQNRRELENLHADLSREKNRLTVILESIGDGLAVTDDGGRLVLWNAGAERITGLAAAEVLGRHSSEVLVLRHALTRLLVPLPHGHSGDASLEWGEVLLVDGQNRERDIALSTAPLRGEISPDRGLGLGQVVVFRDITERKQFLDNAQKAEKLASLGVLAGGIAHDLNNFLGGLFGYLELARSRLAPESEALQFVDRALGLQDRAKGLSQQLLTFAKGGEPVRRAGRLEPVVEDAVTLAVSGKPVTVTYQWDEGLPPCHFDRGQIGQVVNNLALNAVQAMPPGGRIEVRGRVETAAGEVNPSTFAVLEFRDNGPGIPPEVLPRIFDPFYTTKKTGNGLGLAVSASIVAKHGGKLTASSIPGEGAVFRLSLPAASGVGGALEENTQPSDFRGVGSIVIMDDEPYIRETLELLLTQIGFNVVATAHGQEALEALVKLADGGDPAVAVLLDITVREGLGGKEIIGAIREKYPALPAVVISGYSNDRVMGHYQEFGFNAALVKPFRMGDLREVLAKLLATP